VPHSVLGASSRLEQLVEDGIVTVNGSSLRVADDARFLVRTVAAAFDSHLGQSGASHSRAV
jgi:oxygen-independent coproporphyrinogen III oxidase